MDQSARVDVPPVEARIPRGPHTHLPIEKGPVPDGTNAQQARLRGAARERGPDLLPKIHQRHAAFLEHTIVEPLDVEAGAASLLRFLAGGQDLEPSELAREQPHSGIAG